jgi:hypothetical protein
VEGTTAGDRVGGVGGIVEKERREWMKGGEGVSRLAAPKWGGGFLFFLLEKMPVRCNG